MLHPTPAQDGHIIDLPQNSLPNAVPVLVRIPADVYDKIVDVSEDNGQSVDTTIMAQLDKFLSAPLYVTVPPDSLGFFYLKTGQTLAQALGPVKSVRLEVLK